MVGVGTGVPPRVPALAAPDPVHHRCCAPWLLRGSGETARCAGTQTRWTQPSDAPGRPRMNPDEPGCSRAASDGEGAEKQHAKETTSSQPLRGTRSPGLHRAPVAEAPTGTADTRPWRNPTRHPGPLRTAPGENGSVAELPHREPPRNGSDGAAVTPAVAQPPTRPRRQGTQGQHPDAPDHSPTATPGPARTASGKNVLARGCRPGDRKTPRLSAGRNDVPTPRQPRKPARSQQQPPQQRQKHPPPPRPNTSANSLAARSGTRFAHGRLDTPNSLVSRTTAWQARPKCGSASAHLRN